ncbi:hypothetical protein KAR91_50335 [Candidatus Pacearchaeota archaeon]|nr:hypothetical protein [Candidatus Pacearchaeota archaeon]
MLDLRAIVYNGDQYAYQQDVSRGMVRIEVSLGDGNTEVFETAICPMTSDFDHGWGCLEAMIRNHFKLSQKQICIESQKRIEQLEVRIEELEEDNEILTDDLADIKMSKPQQQ